MIYLDNAATTFPKPKQVVKAVEEMMTKQCVNAGRGLYKAAVQATEQIEECRKNILKIAGSNPANSVVLTPSATIAFNMLILGFHIESSQTVYVSAYEHNAVVRPLYQKQKKAGFNIRQIPLDVQTMEVDKKRLEYEFHQYPPDFICMTHVSNVTGYILPVQEITCLAKSIQKDVVVMVDGSQALGLLEKPLQEERDIDYYVFAAHKTLYGIFGLGGFICNSKYAHQLLTEQKHYTPYLYGGTGKDSLNLEMQCRVPEDLECGSQDTVAAAGLLAATRWHLEGNNSYSEEKQKTEKMINGLQNISGVKLYLPKEENRISIVSFNVRGYKADEVAMILDEDYQIAVRCGYHCAPWIHEFLKDKEYRGTVRVSMGRFTTDEEIEAFIKAVGEIAEEVV